jgi:UDP-glucose 4-epimerase
MSKEKVVVTGGAGFIGSHLVDRLVREGHDVIVLDNFSNGRRENISYHSKNKQVRIIHVDVVDTHKILPYFQDVSWVFHLAALADIVPSIENPLLYHRSNVDGTVSVLEAARKHHANKFVYVASSSCYGIPDVFPTPETAPIRTEYPYALTKYVGERYVLHWHKIYNLPVVSLRLFNVYGPRARTGGTYGAVFGVFLAQKYHKKPFTVVGDGTQTRDFTFVTDIVDGLYKAAQSTIQNEIINLGSGNTYSVNRLVELLEGDVIHVPKRPGEPDCTYADISKAQRLLKYSPKVTFEEGVAMMLDHIDHWKDAPVWTPSKIKKATKDWFLYLSK